MKWLHFLGIGKPKTTEQLVAATNIDLVLDWCRHCHRDHPVDFSKLNGVMSSYPAWYAIPPFLALKKIGFDENVPEQFVQPLIGALAADATQTLTSTPASDPDMRDIYDAMIPNLHAFMRIWLAAFSKVKRSYFKDQDVVEAMLTAFIRNPGIDFRKRFLIADEEDEQEFAQTFGTFIRLCNRDLAYLKK